MTIMHQAWYNNLILTLPSKCHSRTLYSKQHFSSHVLYNFGEPVQTVASVPCSKLPGVVSGVLFCCCSPSVRENRSRSICLAPTTMPHSKSLKSHFFPSLMLSLNFSRLSCTEQFVLYLYADSDMQGTEGALGGPDVRRRIPIKLLPKQARKSFAYKQEERFDCGLKTTDAFTSQRRFPQSLFWDYKLNLIGEKDETPVHFCDKCGLPIKTYGRMIPCKHVFCYDCALLHERKGDKMCPGLNLYSCTDPVQRIEQCQRGSLFMCSIVQGCKRTYLSQRDLQAHINHRHMRSGKSSAGRADSVYLPASEVPERFRVPLPHLPKPHVLIPPPLPHTGHDPYNQAPPGSHDDLRAPQGQPPTSDMGPPRSLTQETFRITTVTTRKHSNLITVPIQDDSASSVPRDSAPSHHHPGEYPGQPVVSHPHHMMAPPQQRYGHPPPPPPITHPMQHPAQVFSQAPPPPLSSVPPPITPPPGHLMGQLPPYMNHPPPGPPPQHGGPVSAPPPHHYNPQFPEDKGTLSPPFNQPGGLSPGMWPAPRGPPPRMQGPPPQGPHHPDQGRYRPYYQ